MSAVAIRVPIDPGLPPRFFMKRSPQGPTGESARLELSCEGFWPGGEEHVSRPAEPLMPGLREAQPLGTDAFAESQVNSAEQLPSSTCLFFPTAASGAVLILLAGKLDPTGGSVPRHQNLLQNSPGAVVRSVTQRKAEWKDRWRLCIC